MCMEYERKKAGDYWHPCVISQRQCKLKLMLTFRVQSVATVNCPAPTDDHENKLTDLLRHSRS